MQLQCYFTRASDMSTFLEDVRLIRPTEMLVPPRITSMMYDHFQELLGAKSASSTEERDQQRQASPESTEPKLSLCIMPPNHAFFQERPPRLWSLLHLSRSWMLQRQVTEGCV